MNNSCSGWLSVVPSEENHFDLSPDEFRDALALRYGRQPINFPALGDAFDFNHAMNCPRGVLPMLGIMK